jgi:putative ABC transport system permease protein
MNTLKLLLRSLRFYRGAHLRVVLGTMIGTSVLVGALIIGDSVKYSLRQIVFSRLGLTQFALTSGDRLFRSDIAEELSRILGTKVAPLLQTGGIAIAEGGQRRLNNVQVIGVNACFGEMAGSGDFYKNLAPDEAVVNSHLAARLQVKQGNEILLRIRKLDVIPKDLPLSLDSDLTIARRFKIRDIVGDNRFGRFNLKSNQVAPLNLFLSLSFLSREMGFANRANVLLVQKISRGQVDEAFKKTWTLTDAGLEIRELPGRHIIELKTDRIFLDPPVEDAALKISGNAQPVLTYFVNEIRLGKRSTPYSFVSAPGSLILPPDMKDDEIIINEWLAGDLAAKQGDRVRFTYYVLKPGRELSEASAFFRVKKIVPLRGAYADKSLMPDFPGMSGEQDCRDWHPGIPINLDKIREKDEDYWDHYRGTPKAFVTLKAARNMWRNPFGNVTALRFSEADKKEIENRLLQKLDPAYFGFIFRDVKKEGLLAGSESVDFAGLFLGLSFFLIAAALLLTGLLYAFNVEKRSQENGLFAALGFPGKVIRRLALMEGAAVIVTGSLLGTAAGVLYTQVILAALKTVWHGVVGTSALRIHLEFPTLLLGAIIGAVIAFCTIWIVTGKQLKQPVNSLQKGTTKLETYQEKRPLFSMGLGSLSLTAVIFILVTTKFETGRGAFMFFFSAGILLLIAGMALIKVTFYRLQKKANSLKLNLFNIGVRNNIRRPARSITLIGILACGLFIVFTVGANRNMAAKNSERRESGTGGFALYGESAIPVLYDLNSEKGARFYGLEHINEKGVSYVPFRVKDGDDAGCLNLNRVANPRLIGVNPEELSRRGAFTFVEKTTDVNPEDPWSVLRQTLPDGRIPAVADQTVIIWGLGKAVGDTLIYTDERGREFEIKLVGGLANSIFQGNIIISEKALMQKYPSTNGYRLFLVDAPLEKMSRSPATTPEQSRSASRYSKVAEISKELSRVMQDQGLDIVPAAARLAEFSQVENTYLSIFLILGSFGLILGSIGLGIVLWRNVKERQGEFALLRAVGFDKKAVRKMILSEHILLLAAGIFCGIAAALTATLPAVVTRGSGIPYLTIAILLIVVTLNGFAWIYSAARMAAKGNLLASLRNE